MTESDEKLNNFIYSKMNSVNSEIIELLKSLGNQLKNFSFAIKNIRKSGNQIINNIKGYYSKNDDDFFINLKSSKIAGMGV